MKKVILTASIISGLLFGSVAAYAEDIVVTYQSREANCPAIETQQVTQYFTAPNTCTRIYHR